MRSIDPQHSMPQLPGSTLIGLAAKKRHPDCGGALATSQSRHDGKPGCDCFAESACYAPILYDRHRATGAFFPLVVAQFSRRPESAIAGTVIFRWPAGGTVLSLGVVAPPFLRGESR